FRPDADLITCAPDDFGSLQKTLAFYISADYSFFSPQIETRNVSGLPYGGRLMLSSDLRRLVAGVLVLTTACVAMPLSAADFSTAKSVIGSVSAVGPVELRGIGISQEGTLFAGDTIRSGQRGYVKVLLQTGSKIDLFEKTALNVNRDKEGVKIA